MFFLIGLVVGFSCVWLGYVALQRRAPVEGPVHPLLGATAVAPSAAAMPARAPETINLYVRHSDQGLQVHDAQGALAAPNLVPGDRVVWNIEEGEKALFQFPDAELFDELKAPRTWTSACPVGDALRLTVSSEAPVGTWPYTLFCTLADHTCRPVEPPPQLSIQSR